MSKESGAKDKIEQIKAELAILKRKKDILDSKPVRKKSPTTKSPKKSESKKPKTTPKDKQPTTKSPKKSTDAQITDKTLEEELEEQLSDAEIENFQIEKVNMNQLTSKVCDILIHKESVGMLQNELWKKLKLTNRDGSRLALKLERTGIITREKIIVEGRWTYKLFLKKTHVSTMSIEDAPCLVCPVEQKCSLEGETSPRSCQLIEDWVLISMKNPRKRK